MNVRNRMGTCSSPSGNCHFRETDKRGDARPSSSISIWLNKLHNFNSTHQNRCIQGRDGSMQEREITSETLFRSQVYFFSFFSFFFFAFLACFSSTSHAAHAALHPFRDLHAAHDIPRRVAPGVADLPPISHGWCNLVRLCFRVSSYRSVVRLQKTIRKSVFRKNSKSAINTKTLIFS